MVGFILSMVALRYEMRTLCAQFLFVNASGFDANLSLPTYRYLGAALVLLIFWYRCFQTQYVLYGKRVVREKKDKRMDAYAIVYVAINAGAFIRQFVYAQLGDIKMP